MPSPIDRPFAKRLLVLVNSLEVRHVVLEPLRRALDRTLVVVRSERFEADIGECDVRLDQIARVVFFFKWCFEFKDELL